MRGRHRKLEAPQPWWAHWLGDRKSLAFNSEQHYWKSLGVSKSSWTGCICFACCPTCPADWRQNIRNAESVMGCGSSCLEAQHFGGSGVKASLCCMRPHVKTKQNTPNKQDAFRVWQQELEKNFMKRVAWLLHPCNGAGRGKSHPCLLL